MKTNSSLLAVVLAVLFVWILTARAQGVIHLGPGDSYLFTQPTFVSGQINEFGLTFIVVQLGFTGDLFTLGDSLQIDVLSSPTSLTSLVTGTVSNPPWIIADQKGFEWTGQMWYAPNGAVRLTMLSGSVDVSSVQAITADTRSGIEAHYSYTIPEPGSSLLILFGGALLGGVRWISRQKKSRS